MKKVVLDTNCLLVAISRHNEEYIVSNDKHFDELDDISFPQVNHIKLDAFVKILTKQKNRRKKI